MIKYTEIVKKGLAYSLFVVNNKIQVRCLRIFIVLNSTRRFPVAASFLLMRYVFENCEPAFSFPNTAAKITHFLCLSLQRLRKVGYVYVLTILSQLFWTWRSIFLNNVVTENKITRGFPNVPACNCTKIFTPLKNKST